MADTLVVGLAQIPQTNHLGRNLREIARSIAQAQEKGIALLCFPECALTGYGPVYHESCALFDQDAVEAAVREVRDLGRAMRMGIIIGAHIPADGGWSNSALAVRSDGRLVGRYDKAHLYECDAEYYRAGRAAPKVVAIGGIRIGMQICFDGRFPEPFRRLSLGEAQLIVVSSHIHGAKDMWKQPVYEGHIISRAAENGRFVVFVNAAGPHQNVPSFAVNPRGDVIARCKRGSRQLLAVRLNFAEVNDAFLQARRTDLYGLVRRGKSNPYA